MPRPKPLQQPRIDRLVLDDLTDAPPSDLRARRVHEGVRFAPGPEDSHELAGAALPMGGEATISARHDGGEVVLTTVSKGTKARLKAEMATGLKGELLNEGLAGQWIQGFWLAAVVREAGGRLDLDLGEERVSIAIRMPA